MNESHAADPINAVTGFSGFRKSEILEAAERTAEKRGAYRRRAWFFHNEDVRYLRFLIPDELRVLEIGSGTGDVLAAVKPSYGLGIDFSPCMVAQARLKHPTLQFEVGDCEDSQFISSLDGPFDVILIVDTLGSLDDVQATLENLRCQCTPATRIVIVYYSHLWLPLLRVAEWIGWRAPQPAQNVMPPSAIHDLAELAGLEVITQESRMLSPLRLFGIGRFLNRFVSHLPIVRTLSFRHYTVCRLAPQLNNDIRSATVVVPVRNEKGNVEAAVRRIPRFCEDLEILFVEGNSEDGSFEEIERVAKAYPQYQINFMKQPGKGKGDAVFAAFEAARGDVLMILDGDLTMPPEQLPKFWNTIRSGKGEFINGSRLVYPMEQEAMRFLNLVANKLFSWVFTWLLNQRFTDTLCGTKVLRRTDYVRLKRGREYFGNFDPFGDYDLIFGAAKLNLRCVEIPIRYASRTYGETQISRFRHGLLLLRMVCFAFFRIKAL